MTQPPAQRIGLFGGSFDPVHLGHLLVAQAACEELGLTRLCFVPAAQSPFKPGTVPAPPQARLRWLRLALAGETRYEVDEQEIRRGGVSYTIDTVREYARRFPQATLLYLIGADHVHTLPQWREADALAQLVEFVALPRPGRTLEAPPAPFRVRALQGFPVAISSSEIRARVKAGQPIHNLVPPAVAAAIHQARAYL